MVYNSNRNILPPIKFVNNTTLKNKPDNMRLSLTRNKNVVSEFTGNDLIQSLENFEASLIFSDNSDKSILNENFDSNDKHVQSIDIFKIDNDSFIIKKQVKYSFVVVGVLQTGDIFVKLKL